jgi:hypothetical protein
MPVKHSHYARKRIHRGQLQSLCRRLSPAELEARAANIIARRTVAQKLAQGTAIAMGRANLAMSVIGRGFFGRLKWLALGR